MRRKKFVVVFMIVFTVMLSSFTFYGYQILYTPNILVEKQDQYFAIPTGSTFKDVQDNLSNTAIVQDLISFSSLAKLKKYDQSVKPGMYKLKANMTNLEAVNLLRSGAQTPVNLTFTNIRKIEEVPEKLAPFIESDKEEFSKVLLESGAPEKYGFTKETFISMFIPNTYEVYWTQSPGYILERMKKEYDKFWNSNRMEKAQSINLTPVEVSTLASIVESETKQIDEAPRVAGVYMNRLQRGMPLQADPTVVFALDDFTIRRVLDKDKAFKSPYNTYLNKGLPPGPISMPSIAAIDAVLNYEDHKYLYFLR